MVVCKGEMLYFGNQRTLSRTDKTSGNTFSGKIYCTNTGQILTLRVYVVAALQIRHHIAYELEMGDYDLQ